MNQVHTQCTQTQSDSSTIYACEGDKLKWLYLISPERKGCINDKEHDSLLEEYHIRALVIFYSTQRRIQDFRRMGAPLPDHRLIWSSKILPCADNNLTSTEQSILLLQKLIIP